MNFNKACIEGQRFGRLVAIEPTKGRVNRQVIWLLYCDCGNDQFSTVGELKSGGTKSCGCLRRENMSIMSKKSKHRIKHGLYKNKEYLAGYNRKRRTGTTKEQYEQAFIEQKGCCAICKTHQSELKVSLCADHDHITGKFRGLLCRKCNVGIGFFKDSPELLLKAINYLEEIL
jgi:hypothetical protein